MMNQHAIVDVIVGVKVLRSDAPFQSSLNDLLCHMLIQKKSIIISSGTEILHINVTQCHLILMKHLNSFLRMTILIYSILNLGYCIQQPSMALLHLSNKFMYHDYKWKLLSFLFSFIYLSIHFLPSRRGEEMKTKNEI